MKPLIYFSLIGSSFFTGVACSDKLFIDLEHFALLAIGFIVFGMLLMFYIIRAYTLDINESRNPRNFINTQQ